MLPGVHPLSGVNCRGFFLSPSDVRKSWKIPVAKRVIVFVDAQNTYQGAREAFFRPTDHHACGQVNPLALGKLLCSKVPPGTKGDSRALDQVRVYTGRPDSTKDPRTYGAHMRQCSVWERSGVVVRARPLRYPRDWPIHRAEEKGIDVGLAVDFVTFAVDGAYDVGIIVSTDTDLRPALEYVLGMKDAPAEAAAWCGETPRGLSVPGARLWCHRLGRPDFDSVADYTDYNRHAK